MMIPTMISRQLMTLMANVLNSIYGDKQLLTMLLKRWLSLGLKMMEARLKVIDEEDMFWLFLIFFSFLKLITELQIRPFCFQERLVQLKKEKEGKNKFRS